VAVLGRLARWEALRAPTAASLDRLTRTPVGDLAGWIAKVDAAGFDLKSLFKD